MIIDNLIEKIIAKNNPTCVGLDTDFSYLPQEVSASCKDLQDVANAVFEFNKKIVDATYEIVPAVKVQVAYYEKFGVAGMEAFKKTCQYASQKGLIVIADIKRNDIGSTAGAYSCAYLGKVQVNDKSFSPFYCDFATINGYLGSDGIVPFINDCRKYDKGIFVLVKTSNPSSGELQNLTFQNGNSLYLQCGKLVEDLGSDLIGKYGYSSVGAVVGATHSEEAKIIRKAFPHMFFLIPGYGAQGATAKDLSVSFDKDKLGGIVNSSRGILCAYKNPKYAGQDFATAAQNACLDMKKDLNQNI